MLRLVIEARFIVVVIVRDVVHCRWRQGDRRSPCLGELPVFVEKESFRAFRASLASTPGHHFFHLARDAALFELGLEDLMDLGIFILVLDLMAAFLPLTSPWRRTVDWFACQRFTQCLREMP